MILLWMVMASVLLVQRKKIMTVSGITLKENQIALKNNVLNNIEKEKAQVFPSYIIRHNFIV